MTLHSIEWRCYWLFSVNFTASVQIFKNKVLNLRLMFLQVVVMTRLFIVFCLLFGAENALSDKFLPVDEAFKPSVVVSPESITVRFEIAPNYYLYQNQYSAQINGRVLASNFAQGAVVKYDFNFDEELTVFYDQMSVRHVVQGDNAPLAGSLEIRYQGCADEGLCYPPQTKRFDLQGSSDDSAKALGELGVSLATDSPVTNLQVPSRSLWLITLFAFLGGLILNLMPCVFPVLSLKLTAFANVSHEASPVRRHALCYVLGVVVSFIAIAIIILVLRSFGSWVGWGFQLQSPWFVRTLAVLFFIMALGMAGYIEMGRSLTGLGERYTRYSGSLGSFFTGVLATVVATPCTAPFMGTALGFALTQPAPVTLLVFTFMGLGLAFPMLVVSFMPRLGQLLPKPGLWMVRFRQLMAFPLMLTVFWLLWVLVELTDAKAVFSLGVGLVCIALALWSGLAVQRADGATAKWLKRSTTVGFFILAFWVIFAQPKAQEQWLPYSQSTLTESRASGQPVLVDVTAAWCISCAANKKVALSGERFESLVEQTNTTLIEADWTKPSPEVDAYLASFNYQGVPLYVYYPANGAAPKVLPQVLSPRLIEAVLFGKD